jgi:hypothetical protein
MLDPVNDISIGVKSLTTMSGCRDHDDRRFPDGYSTDPVPGNGNVQLPLHPCCRKNLFDYLLSQRTIGLIFQVGYRPAPIMIPNFAAEQNHCPRAGVMRAGQHRGHVDWLNSHGLSLHALSFRSLCLHALSLSPRYLGER